MVKLIIFDLDGVLVEAKNIHFDALNKALGKYAISWNEHLSTYDGLKTYQKLDMLTNKKGLPAKDHQNIWEQKQKYTLEMLGDLKPNNNLKRVMSKLVKDGYKIAVASNSIRQTVKMMLLKKGLIPYVDFYYSKIKGIYLNFLLSLVYLKIFISKIFKIFNLNFF